MNLRYLSLASMFLSVVAGRAQDTSIADDSLSLSSVVGQVVVNYPAILKAQKNIDAADAKINLAKTAYYPDINFSGQYSRIAPVTKLDLSALGLGVEQMTVADNYGISLNVNQLIYDFGRSAKNKNLQKNSKKIDELTLELSKQQVSLAAAGTFYNIAFLQKALKIKNEELAALNEHLDFVKKKLEAGTATEYAVLSTQVRISDVENQKTDIETALTVQKSQLNAFLGRQQNDNVLVKADIDAEQSVNPINDLTQTAYSNRIELKIAEEKKQISKQKLGLFSSQYYPSFHLFAAGGFRNGYIPDLYKFTPNYQIGVGLHVPIFDQGKTMYGKQTINSEIEADEQEIELTKRLIANEVIGCQTSIEAAKKKMQQSQMQLTQAMQAYKLAQVSYESGSITNLDLLDSYTKLSDSELSLYKSQIDYTLNILKLKAATGGKIY